LYAIPALQEALDKRIDVWGLVGQKTDTLQEKNLMQIMAGDVAQLVEHLPSKHKTLSLIPNTAKKRRSYK
jgi:hypothetical protein